MAPPGSGGSGTDYFAHDADVGVCGRGATPVEAMEQAAIAMFSLMADPGLFYPEERVKFSFEEDDLQLALLAWLNRLLAETRVAGIFPAKVSLKQENSHWHGSCEGSAWRPEIERGTEVKGATLTMAAVENVDGTWEARCVVDV